MDKIKLVDGTEYDCSNSVAWMDSLTVTLYGITDFVALRNKLTRNNIAEINIIASGGITGVYENFVKVSPYTITDNEDGTMNITITFGKEDLATMLEETRVQLLEAQETITELEENQTNTEIALVELYELMIGG